MPMSRGPMRLASVRNKIVSALHQSRPGTEEYACLLGAIESLDAVEGEALFRLRERWTAADFAAGLRLLERTPSGRWKPAYRRGRPVDLRGNEAYKFRPTE
jgi:hypothetical protein